MNSRPGNRTPNTPSTVDELLYLISRKKTVAGRKNLIGQVLRKPATEQNAPSSEKSN